MKTMAAFSILAPVVMALATGCENTVVGNTGGNGGSGGSGGAGGDGGATVTTSSTLPSECAVETSEQGPYAVTFRFTTTGDVPVYLREDCVVNYTVTSCGDGYQEGLALTGQCTVDCSEDNQCIDCGACLLQALTVSAGAAVEHPWAGKTYTFEENNVGCTCHEEHVAPAGKYRITVPVFASEADAVDNNSPAGQVSVDFVLPAPGGVVEVPVALP